MIADSSAWIEMFRGTGSPAHLRLRRALRKREPLWMPHVVYQELLQGARSPSHFMQLQTELDTVLPFEPDAEREIARTAGMLYARCRWRGLTIRSPNDCVVAACALAAELPLLHADRDFEVIASIEPHLQLL